MNKRFSWIFLLASGAFFVLIVGLTGYRIEDARRHNGAAARESAAALAARVHSLADTTGSVQSPLFANAMRDVFDADPRLLLVSVHSQRDGILYLLTRNRALLKEPATVTPEWRGTPVYQVNRGSELLVTSSVGSDMPGLTVDALFVVMGREDLYLVVRDDLYFFLAFLLVVGVAILIVMSIEEQSSGPSRRVGPSTASAGPGGGSATGQDRGPWGPAAEPARETPPPPANARQAPVPMETFSAGGREAAPFSSGQPQAPTSVRERRDLTSPRTGLVWAEYLEPRLAAELERAAASDGEISFARLQLDEPFADARLPMAYAEIARMLTQTFPLHDLLFESGDDGYAVILPDADVDAAVRLLEDLREKVASRQVEGRSRTLSAGVSSRGGRLINAKVLREEAQVALAKAGREGGNQVVGFRADPARFREKLVIPTG